jgi:hypothetical protein
MPVAKDTELGEESTSPSAKLTKTSLWAKYLGLEKEQSGSANKPALS